MKSKILVLLILGAVVAAGVSSYFGRQNIARALHEKAENEQKKKPFQPVSIVAAPVPLNPEDETQKTVGELNYVAGWSLSSDHDDFGGWSGFTLKEGREIVAINDQGNWLKATFDIEADQPIANARLALFDQSGEAADKVSYDAESLIAIPTGYLVGFEQRHRIVHVDAPNTGTVMPFETGVDFSGMSKNSGIEAMTLVSGNRLLMFAENGRDVHGRTKAWLAGSGNATLLDFMPPENYAPTDAATLPNGDVLLLLRHYSVMTGASARLLHIPAAEIESGVVRGREIAAILPPLSVDNMEGLDVSLQQNGDVRLYLVSDDNFSSRQRTLLMVFDWTPNQSVADNIG